MVHFQVLGPQNRFFVAPSDYWKQMTSKPVIKEKLESNLEYLLENDHRGLEEWDIKLKIIQENFLKVHCLLPNFS